jgi:predicted RNase H-like HicB family nuclease
MTMTTDEREIEIQRRMHMPYHRVVRGDPADGYVASIVEFEGCLTDGDTPSEALSNLDEAMAGWLESCLLHGDPIPSPAAHLVAVAS